MGPQWRRQVWLLFDMPCGICPAFSSHGRECPAGEEKVGERKKGEELSGIFGDAAISNLAIAEHAVVGITSVAINGAIIFSDQIVHRL